MSFNGVVLAIFTPSAVSMSPRWYWLSAETARTLKGLVARLEVSNPCR